MKSDQCQTAPNCKYWRFRQKQKSGEPGGVSPRILSCNLKSPRAYAARLTTSVGNVNVRLLIHVRAGFLVLRTSLETSEATPRFNRSRRSPVFRLRSFFAAARLTVSLGNRKPKHTLVRMFVVSSVVLVREPRRHSDWLRSLNPQVIRVASASTLLQCQTFVMSIPPNCEFFRLVGRALTRQNLSGKSPCLEDRPWECLHRGSTRELTERWSCSMA